jgi:flagellar biosynthesis component FlhA
MTLSMIPTLAVLSYNEVTRDTIVESVGMASYQPKPTRQPAAAP